MAAAAIIVLLAVAAAGSGALREPGQPSPERTAWSLLLMFFAVVPASIIAIAAFVQAVRHRDFGGGDESEERWAARHLFLAIGILLLVLAIAFVVVVATSHGVKKPIPRPQVIKKEPAQGFDAFTATTLPPKPRPEALSVTWWMAAGSVVLAGAMAMGLVLMSRGRRRVKEPEPAAPAAEPGFGAHVVEASMDALISELDARAAVIAAYESMERAMAECGIPRPPWETPFEYVDRILMQLGATAGTAARLTELFEEAKFSSHPVGPEMKAEALDALTTLQLELVAV